MKGLVYLVEDDENIRELVTYTLNSQGIETESFEGNAAGYSIPVFA